MTETRKIVVEHAHVEDLPETLRRGLESRILVRVTVEAEAILLSRSLMSFIGAGQGVYTEAGAVSGVRARRGE